MLITNCGLQKINKMLIEPQHFLKDINYGIKIKHNKRIKN